jgi:hypothetical protein
MRTRFVFLFSTFAYLFYSTRLNLDGGGKTKKKTQKQVALETEVSNTAAIKLYERLGFLRSKRLHHYYLNGNSAYRLLLYLKEGVGSMISSIDASLSPAGSVVAPELGHSSPPLAGPMSVSFLAQENGEKREDVR